MSEQIEFGTLKVGQRFTLTPDSEYHNIKVRPAKVTDDPEFDHLPFNTINLWNGQPRTFRDHETVYVVHAHDIGHLRYYATGVAEKIAKE